MNNILVIFKKQIIDTFKNKSILLQVILYPVITLVMEALVRPEGMPAHYYTKMFSAMYVGMTPLISMTSIIAEEKEKNTLRVLLMSNVKPWQYLTGIGAYVWVIFMFGTGVMATAIEPAHIPFYLLIMGLSAIVSIAIGACVGINAKNQMSATSQGSMVMLMLSFLPMLAMFNDGIAKVANFVYTQHVRAMLDEMSFSALKLDGAIIVAVNTILAVALFIAAYRKKGLE
ncbi:MAG: ABC transporter permease [Lachnospiraceae bacterium]|nr:ABC transporter permease [Lachnospiraceae bacterium]